MAKKETYIKKAKKLWKKQERRIKELRKRGYIIPDQKPLPKKVDKKVFERLEKKLTLDELYNSPNSYYIETNTKGEQKMVSAKRGRELERSRAGKKGAITKKRKKVKRFVEPEPPKVDWAEAVIAGIGRQISEISQGYYDIEQELNNILDVIIERDGTEATARRIFDIEAKIDDIIGEIVFYYETRNHISYRLINEFKEILLGRSLYPEENMKDYLTIEDNEDDYLEV